MQDTNFDLMINAVFYQYDCYGNYPEYVQVDAVFYDCDVRRACFYLPFRKFIDLTREVLIKGRYTSVSYFLLLYLTHPYNKNDSYISIAFSWLMCYDF